MKILSAGIQGVVNVEVTNISLTAALGGFELAFWVQGQTTTPATSHWVAAHSAEVHVGGAQGALSRLGVARPSAPLRDNTGSSPVPVHWEFRIPITAHQLAAIEGVRGSGGLQFKLVVSGEGGPQPPPHRIERLHDELHRPFAQSDWIRELNNAKAMDILLLEIAMPFVEPSIESREIATTLKKAQQLFAEGNFAESVGSCRKAMESLIALEGWGEDWQSAARAVPTGGRRKMSKGQRERAVEASLWEFLHLGAHVAGVEITRRDAKLAISLTASVLAHR